METGTILVDRETGVKLLVVESPTTEMDASCVRVDGRSLAKEASKPGGDTKVARILTNDPGGRG